MEGQGSTSFTNVEKADQQPEPTAMSAEASPEPTKDDSVVAATKGGITAFDVENDSIVKSDSSKPKLQMYPFLVFLSIGTVQLLGWNSMLNAMNPMFTTVFGIDDHTVTVTAAYSTTLAVITIIFMFVNVVSVKTVYLGLALSAVLSIVFGLVSQFATANSAAALFHVLGAILAISAACIGSSAFGYAAQFPVDYSGAMSAGLGCAGVVTFVFWMIGNHAAFDGKTADGTRSTIWLLCAVMAVLSLLAIGLAWSLFRKPWVQALFNKQSDVEGQAIVEEGTYEKEGLAGVLKRSGWMGAMYFLSFTCTLALFPTFGPLGWYEVKINDYKEANNSETYPASYDVQRDVLMGVFQVCDLVARYVPNVLPFLNVNAKIASCIILGRYVFFALFIMSAKLTSTFFAQFWFLVIEQMLMTLTNGWMCTVCFARMFETVEGGEAKARVASFSLLCTFIGIAAGQWIGFGLKKAIIG